MLFWLKNKRKTTKKHENPIHRVNWLIEVKLFNFFNVMGQNIYVQTKPDLRAKYFNMHR